MGIAAMMSSLVPVGASIGIMGVVLLVAVFRMRRKITKLEAENEMLKGKISEKQTI